MTFYLFDKKIITNMVSDFTCLISSEFNYKQIKCNLKDSLDLIILIFNKEKKFI